MFKDNLIMLRNIHGYFQEFVAEKLDISRQAYAKWESGDTVPNIDKCSVLADLYGVSMDSLINQDSCAGISIPPAPKGKNIWGSVTINDRGQLVIPKEARDKFNLKDGSRLIVLSDDEGIALVPADKFEENFRMAMKLAGFSLEKTSRR